MVKIAEKTIKVQEYSGALADFDAGELQGALARCFMDAGMRELASIAGDVAMAVEYTLLNSQRSDGVFGRGEINAAVVRMLEETGFPEVAELFRRSGGESVITLRCDSAEVGDFLRKYLACSSERFGHIVEKVTSDMAKLGISDASLHLLLELARHYERAMASAQPPEKRVVRRRDAAVKQSEIQSLLPADAAEFSTSGVLRFDGISEVFPCIHVCFFINKLAEREGFGANVTELEIAPWLYRVGEAIGAARSMIEKKYSSGETMPLAMSVPDMSDFVVAHLGGERLKFRRSGGDIARAVEAAAGGNFYKIKLS